MPAAFATLSERSSVCWQVLIFSQFKIMLNVLEDYLRLAGYPFERIDGDVKSRDRQNAIDRFSKGAHAGSKHRGAPSGHSSPGVSRNPR